MCQKYENWLAVDKVIAKLSGLLFWHTLYSSTTICSPLGAWILWNSQNEVHWRNNHLLSQVSHSIIIKWYNEYI